MTTTPEEDKQYLNEVKEEIKKKTSWKTTDIYNRRSKRESKTIRFKTIQRKQRKKIEMVKRCQRAKKEREKLKLEETKTN